MAPLSFLRQPYPFDESWQRTLRRSALIGAFVGIFLLVFQPFGLNEWNTEYKALKILGFGGVTFGVLLLNVLGVPRLLPGVFTEAHWTVGREIAFILTSILLIAVTNRFYLAWLLPGSGRGGWLQSLGMTFLIGIFPTVGVVLTKYIVQLRQYSRDATALSGQLEAHPHPAPPPATALTLRADNGKDALTLLPADLLALESSDNYCTVYFLNKGQPDKELMRSSLGRLETQLSEQLTSSDRPFARCHRSFVVNLDRVDRVSGNAQGYKLHLSPGGLVVPVSRQYNSSLVKKLKNGE